MKKSNRRIKTLLVLAGALVLTGVLGAALYSPLIRPWHMRYGASEAEARMTLAGDEIVTGANITQSTRAIDVQAPAEILWAWLVQIGQGRGGWFSYDFLENLAGCDIHTLDVIVPELQNLKVGDILKLGPYDTLPYYEVVQMNAPRVLIIRSVDPKTKAFGETWGFYLQEQAPGMTRLVIRHRTPASENEMAKAVSAVFEPISFVMEFGMLHGLRDHAEKIPVMVE